MKKSLIIFFARKGINKVGICTEAGVSPQYLNRILAGSQPITDSFVKKILPVLERYGFQPHERQEEKNKNAA